MALIVALSAQGMETVYAQDIVDTVENRIEVQESNYASLKVITEGKGTVAINGQTLTGGDVSVKAGESVRVNVNPSEGYELDKVEVNGVVLTKDNAPSAMESLANGYFDYTFWGDQANSIKVTFAKVETNQTTLKVTTEGKGSVEINGQTLTGGDVSVKTGESVRVNVNPSEGYELDKVEVNGVVLTKDNAPSAMESLANGYFDYTFWGDQANSVKVTFAKVETNQTTLKVTTEGKGSVEINGQTLTGGDVSVKTGESVRVNVNPSEGYELDKVEVNGVVLTKDNAPSAMESLANGYFDYTFWGDQANSVKVTFAKVETNQTTLKVTTEGNGSVEINGQTLTGGDVSVKTGEEVRVKVNPSEGYELDKVEVNGVVLTKDNAPSAMESLANGYFDYTFWGDQANSVKVTFAKVETNQTTLKVTTEGKGSVEINGQTLTGGDVSVKTGESVRVKVNPAEGYKVDKVEVNGIVLTKDNAASAVESLAKNGYFDYTFWGDQANSVKVTFAKVETNQTILNVTTEGNGSVEINGQTLTGGDVSVKTGESVRVKVNPAEGYKLDKVEVNGIVLTKDNAASAVESLAKNGYFDYTFWGDQANSIKITFSKVENSDNPTEEQKPGDEQKPGEEQKPGDEQKPSEEQKPGDEEIKEELPQTGAPVNAASMGMLGLTSLLGGLFLKKKR
ncbi:InlB B-repeat-containing protein [Clostridium perfringens]|uniref:InlB B-repeat-containing protein n=1 Tax=Clostridium perfringens TaxID=1502 RepID=UPI001CCF8423|nr:LPXTG cell wall anchor domain-containing protein [Clostridium perfringens]